jgi:hypothetical protein
VSTRRRYKSDPPAVNVAVAPAPAPPAAPDMPAGPSPGVEDNPLQRALEAQQHAESLQHQHAQRQRIGLPEPELDPQRRQHVEAHIDSMGLSAHKARFLKSHPSLLSPPYNRSMANAYHLALHAGVADDTVAMDHAILAGVSRDIEHHRALSQLTAADARPTPENHAMHHDVSESADALMREAEAHLAEYQPEPAASPPAKRRSIPMSAPVSRDIPGASGQRIDNGNTLRADERQIARVSFPHLSPPQAEYAYLQNKKRMMAMKADGRIQGDG